MSYRFNVPDDVHLLVQEYDSETKRQIKDQIMKKHKYPVITVWNDTVIDAIEEFELCSKNDIPYRIKSVSLSSKAHMYSWVCAKQLTRDDLNKTMFRFLIGFQVLSEMSINGAHYNAGNYGRETAIIHVAELYSLKRQRVSWYKIFTTNLMKIYDLCPELVNFILSEKLLASWNNVEYLSKKNEEELNGLLENLNITEIGEQIKFNDLMKEIDKDYKPTRAKKNWIEPGSNLEIKKMPEYDPDAELKSLSLTIHSWINSICRITDKELTGCTRRAKSELSNDLNLLIKKADKLKQHLGVK